eukprot:c5411_g1_i1 orf=203-2092(-)
MKFVLAILLLWLCFPACRAGASFRSFPSENRHSRKSEPRRGRLITSHVELDARILQPVHSDSESSRRFQTLPHYRGSIQSEQLDGHLLTSDEERIGWSEIARGRLMTSDWELDAQLKPSGAGGLISTDSELHAQLFQSEASSGHMTTSNLDVDADQSWVKNWDIDAANAPAIWITLAQRGLDYLKDVLLTQVLETITPLPLPNITKTARIPFVGDVSASFTNVTLVHAEVPSSTIALGEIGVAMQASSVAANLTMDWQYEYHNMWLPGPVSDTGGADIKVVGMQAGVSVNMQEYMGTLQLSVLQCGTYIENLEVQLKGESSWLYQWLVDGLEDHMSTTIEEQLSGQIQEGVQNLNLFLLDTPQQVEVDDVSELNFTIVSEPIVSPTSLSIGVKGKFNSRTSTDPVFNDIPKLPPGLVCNGNTKMVTIALSESVFKDGAALYYNADLLNWLVDKVPEQAFLNTSRWKFLIPQLYQQYPNQEIKLSFEVSAPPNITLTLDGVDMSAAAHMIIGVASNDSVVQVACVNIIVSASGLAGLNENNLTGRIALKDLSLDLEWSNVGKIHLTLVKVFVKTLVKDVLLPYVNLSLRRGFPLPIIPSMKLKDSTVDYGDGFLLVCTDVQYVKDMRNLP